MARCKILHLTIFISAYLRRNEYIQLSGRHMERVYSTGKTFISAALIKLYPFTSEWETSLKKRA